MKLRFQAFVNGPKSFPLDANGVFQLASTNVATTYKEMKTLLSTGKVRALSVSNFNNNRVEDLLAKRRC